MPRSYLVTSALEFERLRPLWTALYRPGVHTMFQSFEWNLLAARCFQRESPRVIALESSAGGALLPACAGDGRMGLLGDALFDYRDLLADSPEAAAQTWEQVSGLGMDLEITAIRGEEARQRWRAMGFDAVPFVRAPEARCSDIDAAAFEARHHRSGRLVRRLARAGATFHEHAGAASAPLLRAIYEAKAAQLLDAGPNLFTDPARRDFLVAAGQSASCDVHTFESAGTLVAALVTFRDHRVRRFYTIYYDHAWAHYSPGVALLFEVTRRTLASGLDCDYMTGEQPHKMRFATSFTPLFRVSATAAQLAQIAGASILAA